MHFISYLIYSPEAISITFHLSTWITCSSPHIKIEKVITFHLHICLTAAVSGALSATWLHPALPGIKPASLFFCYQIWNSIFFAAACQIVRRVDVVWLPHIRTLPVFVCVCGGGFSPHNLSSFIQFAGLSSPVPKRPPHPLKQQYHHSEKNQYKNYARRKQKTKFISPTTPLCVHPPDQCRLPCMVLWCISVELLCLHLLFWKIPSSAGVHCSPFGHKDSSLYAATEMVKIENVQEIYGYMMKTQNACQHVSFPLIGCMELCFYSHQMGRIPQCAHSSVFPKTGLITE